MGILNFYIISHFVIGLISIILGIIVISKNNRKNISLAFFLLAASVSIWSFSYSIWLLAKSGAQALFWARLLNLAATFIPVFYLHWVLDFLNVKRKKLLYFYYSLTLFFTFFTFSPYYITGTYRVFVFPFWPLMGWMYFVFLILVWCIILIYTFYLLFSSYKDSFGSKKQQSLYVLLGSVIGFLGGSTNYLLMLRIELFPPIASPFVAAFPVIFFYAMVKHRLMDIKFVLRKSSVYFFSLATVILLAFGARMVVDSYFLASNQWFDALILIAVLAVYPFVRKRYYHLANKYFFSSLYDSREVIVETSNLLRSTLDINKIYDILYKTLNRAFHLRSFGFLNYDEATDSFLTQYNINFNIGRRVRFENNPVLSSLYADSSKPLIVEELKQNYYNSATKDIIDLLINFKIELLIPLTVKDRLIGLLVLGGKESHDIYNDEDLQLLEVIAAQSSTAIENALLYEETKNFSIKLEKRVEQATSELVAANRQLKKLDQAKSEFISIASHQLRTPLTVIKGYISMLLDGNFGELNEKEKDALDKVYESNERLIQLVENLLNISRIEAERVQFRLTSIQMEDLVGSVVDELSQNAKKKGLKLTFDKPKKSLPAITLDEEKIRQVIMNLIDNAIKYTKEGEIKVCLKKEGNNLKFRVVDTGMGIHSEDRGNFFKKFVRGSGTSLVHTEGTGLGLYVARKMIEAHHGKIWVESKGVGKGSCFCFVIPYNINSKGIKKIEKDEDE